jgi:hypothetical protein
MDHPLQGRGGLTITSLNRLVTPAWTLVDRFTGLPRHKIGTHLRIKA